MVIFRAFLPSPRHESGCAMDLHKRLVRPLRFVCGASPKIMTLGVLQITMQRCLRFLFRLIDRQAREDLLAILVHFLAIMSTTLRRRGSWWWAGRTKWGGREWKLFVRRGMKCPVQALSAFQGMRPQSLDRENRGWTSRIGP